MNVSFTRARSKLIIFGSRKTLKAAPFLGDFFRLMEEKEWVLALPENADRLHDVVVRSKKRDAVESGDIFSLNELHSNSNGRRLKKMKMGMTSEEGLLRGRPILKDLMNDNK